ncbi:putative cytochrome P450 superfamily protein isoform X1 [Carex littledalei]|uniref:Putative cytochrome P450 superfamily protein isoform X1 n=1 Tax=Carex littledalei TaxID=544730 RepID=A0A833VMX6_9POAL|nr:putative cytochrome P450 superfamily protein isoform X1 [Carex littledalei]
MGMKVLDILWFRPKRLEEHFAKQGIRGPPYRFFLGSVKEMVALMVEASSKPMVPQTSHNIFPRVLAFYHYWKKIYGSTVLIWFGPTPRLAVSDPEMIREIFLSRSEYFDRYESHPLVRQLEGDGLVSLHGEKWAHHRKVLNPAFYMDNLKLLVPFVGKTVADMAEKLTAMSASAEAGEVEIDLAEWFQIVTEDAITRTVFGSSYEDGKAVFKLQTQLMSFAAEAFRKVFIPGYRYIPIKRNRQSWILDREIRKGLQSLIARRQQEDSLDAKEPKQNGLRDLLGLMINSTMNYKGAPSAGDSPMITIDDMVEECKTFFFAGKQTTSNLLTWASVLLAMHPDWQERARQEVLEVCGPTDLPSKEHLPKLKMIGMILSETLRLYPPAVATIRRAKADVELGGYMVPQDTELLIPILAVHHDTHLWGPDASQFNPARFENGAARAARHPLAYIPFGLGARMCIGQNLAILEAKITLAILLQRFSFRTSPSYVHAPTVLMLLYPQYGAPVVFRPIEPSWPSDPVVQ